MKPLEKIWRMKWLAGVLAVLCLSLPQTARGHGELLIRIGEMTKKIQAATNHLGELHLQRAELYREDQN